MQPGEDLFIRTGVKSLSAATQAYKSKHLATRLNTYTGSSKSVTETTSMLETVAGALLCQ
jgi:hypothetical protein